MSDDRLNELLNGSLGHPMPLFRLIRLAIALRAVVEATGRAGEEALEAHCRERQEQDERQEVYDDGD